MFKRIFLALTVAFAMMFTFTADATTVEARPVYMGTYSDGTDAYLLTESVYLKSRHPYTFDCTITYSGVYLYYSFFPYNGSPYYRNSEGYEGYVFVGQSPVAAQIYNYVVNNY